MQDGTFLTLGHSAETSREAGLRGDVFAANCPTRRLLDRIADKWSVLILMTLAREPMRFSALRRRIEGVSQKMLSQTLRTLERDGLISRSVAPTVPVSVTYAITPLGSDLVAVLGGMIDWAETRMGEVARAQSVYDRRNGA